jgi:hypothetical protein
MATRQTPQYAAAEAFIHFLATPSITKRPLRTKLAGFAVARMDIELSELEFNAAG